MALGPFHLPGMLLFICMRALGPEELYSRRAS